MIIVTTVKLLIKGLFYSNIPVMKKYSVGIDIGGTNIPSAIIDDNGKVIYSIHKEISGANNAEVVIKKITDSINALLDYFDNNIKGGKIMGVGLGVPGALDHKNGRIIVSPNLPFFKDYPIVERISKELKLPVFIDNDANCATIGEHWIGSAQGSDNVIFLTLGTGVGGGIIINKKIYTGSHGIAGELGHITIVDKGRKCACGNFGCLEAYASANSTVARALEQLQKTSVKSTLKKLKPNEITAHTIFINAENGDEFSENILKESGMYLGIGIASFANIFDPDAIIIGGGFAKAEKYLIPSAIEEAHKRCLTGSIEKIKISRASLENDAGVIGAGRLALY